MPCSSVSVHQTFQQLEVTNEPYNWQIDNKSQSKHENTLIRLLLSLEMLQEQLNISFSYKSTVIADTASIMNSQLRMNEMAVTVRDVLLLTVVTGLLHFVIQESALRSAAHAGT
jgi:hypothetical protein